MSVAKLLLDRLEGVRSTGHDKWIARCPAHDDKRPSLSIREGDTGATLAYCWAGCSIAEIAAAVGLELSDLFPPRLPDVHSTRPRASALTPFVATFERDLLIVQILLADLAQAKPIAADDCVTAKAAASRVWNALQEARRVI